MIVLDSDHLSILQQPESPQFSRLIDALENSVDQEIVTTVVSLEEQLRGWLAAINRKQGVHDQTRYYARLAGLIDFYSQWRVLPFDEAAAERFSELRQSRIRIGSMDLKIASITIVCNALLLSANLRDFEKVPGLRLENWLTR
jgi:tRNA(fMet)-specific endonuclease VapC